MSIKIEVGKHYKDRAGRKCRVLATDFKKESTPYEHSCPDCGWSKDRSF